MLTPLPSGPLPSGASVIWSLATGTSVLKTEVPAGGVFALLGLATVFAGPTSL